MVRDEHHVGRHQELVLDAKNEISLMPLAEQHVQAVHLR